MMEPTEEEALAMLDLWASGETDRLHQQTEESALSQAQARRLWSLVSQPASKGYLDSASNIPR